jgi:uncharacterized protein YbjT (DUF2867 family)
MPTNKKNNKVILVTGATGRQGGAALRHLGDRGFACRALTRNPDNKQARAFIGRGTELVRGDMEDPASLSRALEGVYGVYAVQTPYESGVEAEVRQGFHLIDAAQRAGIAHFVYSSVASADQSTRIPHFDSKFRIEEHLRGTGMHYTIVRPVFFMENWLAMRQMIEEGAIALPLDPTTRLQMVAVDDIGGVVAMAFERSGKWQGRAFEIAGDELSMTELAETFSRAAGREVQYQQLPWEEFEARSGSEATTMYRWFQDVGYHVDIPAVRQEYPKLNSFVRWLNSNWHSATQTA